MNMIKIEKNIPAVAPRKNIDSEFTPMRVGDSFAMPFTTVDELKAAKSMSAKFRSFAKKVDWKVSCHVMDNQLRCWRV